MPDGARQKNCWFYLVSWTKNLKENWRKLARLSQTTPDSVSFCNQSKILTLSGTIWPTSFKFPSNFWSRKPDGTSNFFIWLRLAWFCLAVWAWCSQSIKKHESENKILNRQCDTKKIARNHWSSSTGWYYELHIKISRRYNESRSCRNSIF